MFSKRYLEPLISQAFSDQKMAFVGGARQVGKTTLSFDVINAKDETHPAYFNWDIPGDVHTLIDGKLPPKEGIIVLDEIHKYGQWRNLVKGLYDGNKSSRSFLVTGSARLDYYRKGGDGLLGRYRYFRLHPFSINELGGKGMDDTKYLLEFGGFPEICLSGNHRKLRLWQRERLSRLVRDDLRDMHMVRDVSLIELLASCLEKKVGSPLSIQSLRSDISVAHQTLESWITMLENLYFCFRIAPFGSPKIKAVKKEKKLYLWDWSSVQDHGAKFENMVAMQLLKYCHLKEDHDGYRMELRYIRDINKRETDFVVLCDDTPEFAVEVKSKASSNVQSMMYFKERTAIPKWFQVHLSDDHYVKNDIQIMPFHIFCQNLNMP